MVAPTLFCSDYSNQPIDPAETLRMGGIFALSVLGPLLGFDHTGLI